jgi:hypothetical protein
VRAGARRHNHMIEHATPHCVRPRIEAPKEQQL